MDLSHSCRHQKLLEMRQCCSNIVPISLPRKVTCLKTRPVGPTKELCLAYFV